MRKLTYLIPILVAALLATSASALTKPKKIAFVGNYSGQASTLVDGNTVTITAKGNGTGTMIGAGALTAQGTGDSSQQPCVPFGGTGTLTGASGTIFFKTNAGANGCGDDGGHNFTIKAYFAVTKATGKLAKAKGTLKAIGTYSRDDGSFTAKVTGTLTK